MEPVVGVAVEGALKKLVQAIKIVIRFESILQRLKGTVLALSLHINKIAELKVSEALQDQIIRLVLLLEEAEELIKKCSKIAWWNYCKKYRYSKKLIELDASLNKASTGLIPAVWENIFRIQEEINELNQKLERIMHEKSAYRLLKRSRTKVLYVTGGLKNIIQSVNVWIYSYLNWIWLRRRSGYRRISSCYRPSKVNSN